jgi:hypothetical protein
VSWCKFFLPKIASPWIKADDPDLNDHIMYAKCIKGHVLKDADDWILCENLPAPAAKCWQEGGDTIFSLQYRQRQKSKVNAGMPEHTDDTATQAAKS